MRYENRNYAFAGAFVDDLARAGLGHVSICPGSRSSPLTISFDRHPGIRAWYHLDERSAAYFALGMARALRRPVAVVCSSGTAAANFHPAVAEAHNDRVPLLVLTADRPPEVRGWGALQTINQSGLYGNHAKWSVDLPAPDAATSLLRYARSMAGRAYSTAAALPPGPVHLNFPFREPLAPAQVAADFGDTPLEDDVAWHGRPAQAGYLSHSSPVLQPSPSDLARLASQLDSTKKGIIICGPQSDEELPSAVVSLAGCLGYPVLADALSRVRCGPHDRSLVLDSYDALVRDAGAVESLRPEVVLRFGAMPVSKPLTQYLEHHRGARQIMVDDGMGWRDPFHLTSEVWHASPVSFCEGLSAILGAREEDTEWCNRWRALNDAASEVIRGQLAGTTELFEGRIFTELAALLPAEASLFAGNSMPVRDMDSFFPAGPEGICFFANRGASGIDGVTSTALGVGAASGKRVVLVVGDVSFYHDMNGLLAAKTYGVDATIIVVNNDGGGIFSFLPQAAYPEVFERCFGTPHGLTFEATAKLYGLGYAAVGCWEDFRHAVGASFARPGTTIIEVPGERQRNVELHREVWQAVAERACAHALGRL